ncbi:MAG: 50S ribosomal protein L29 [Armatimonadota bacterium]|nr:MAG: 50S ribosomal protein L29 [Armatimonadota bacterium]
MKKAELRKTVREASDAELDKQLEDARKELFHLRYQRATKQLEKPHRIREARKQIARLLQERTERRKAREAS